MAHWIAGGSWVSAAQSGGFHLGGCEKFSGITSLAGAWRWVECSPPDFLFLPYGVCTDVGFGRLAFALGTF